LLTGHVFIYFGRKLKSEFSQPFSALLKGRT